MKYSALGKHLKGLGNAKLEATFRFDEIETIIGRGATEVGSGIPRVVG